MKIGYILPIENYQAQYYHERMTYPERDPIPIDRIYPKKIEIGYQAATDQEMMFDQRQMHQAQSNNRYQPMTITPEEKAVYADLTGIGGHINMSV